MRTEIKQDKELIKIPVQPGDAIFVEYERKHTPRIKIFHKAIPIIVMITILMSAGIAHAETGTLTIAAGYGNSYDVSPETNTASSAITTFIFDYVNYSSITSVSITNPLNTFNNVSNSTTFLVSGCGAGSGIVSYDAVAHIITWHFSGTTITSSSCTITYAQNIFSGSSLKGTSTAGLIGVNFTQPIKMHWSTPVVMSGIYISQTQFTTTNGYDVKYASVADGILFNATITKQSISTKITISDELGTLFQEPTSNSINFTTAYILYNRGIIIKAETSNGDYGQVVVNSTNCQYPGCLLAPAPPAPPLSPDPITGVGIQFDQSDYAPGDIANITWIRTIPTPLLSLDYIVLIRPGNIEEELISSPPDSGYFKILMIPAGTWGIEFRRFSFISGKAYAIASDVATVGADNPSYIIAPAQVAIGKSFNVTYKVGWTISQGTGAWVRAYHFDDGTGMWEDSYQPFLIAAIKGVESNTSIIVTKKGKYLLKLCDVLAGCKASTSTEAFFNGSEVTANVTISNISIDRAAYSYGDTMLVDTRVDNTNWSNKQIVVEYYDYATGTTQNQQYIQAQIQSFGIHISDNTFSFSGQSAMRLVGKNDTGIYILNSTDFTLSSTDAEGYGMSIIGNTTCQGNIIQIKAIVPAGETANLSISADNSKYNKEFVVNGSRVYSYKIPIMGSYYVTLRKDGEAKRLIVFTANSCAAPPAIPPGTGQGGAQQAQQLASMLVSSIFWSLLVTGGLMIFIAVKTRDGLPTGIIGMFSMGTFTFIGWLPAWIFFTIFIIAALLVASSIVEKQMRNVT